MLPFFFVSFPALHASLLSRPELSPIVKKVWIWGLDRGFAPDLMPFDFAVLLKGVIYAHSDGESLLCSPMDAHDI